MCNGQVAFAVLEINAQVSSIYRWCRGIFITDALWSTWNWSNVDFLEELNLKHQSKYKMTHLLGDMIRSKYKMTHFLGDMLTFNPWMALFFLEILWSCFLPWNFIYLSLVIVLDGIILSWNTIKLLFTLKFYLL